MGRLQQLFQTFQPNEEDMRTLMASAMVLHGEEAVRHLLRVTAGLESMVLGEREILTQVRSAMERSREWKLAGDQLRITERIAVETAKQVFTETDIARNSVSVNALGWKAFLERGLAKDAPVLIIGAGQTHANIARYLVKDGYTHVHVLNRTVDRADALAGDVTVGITDPDDDPSNAGLDEGVTARTGATGVITRLECGVERRTAYRVGASGIERDSLRVAAAGRFGGAVEDLPVEGDDNGANPGVG